MMLLLLLLLFLEAVVARPRPPECGVESALGKALLDSLSHGYMRHRRGPLQRELNAAGRAVPVSSRAFQLRVRAALMDSLCYPGGKKR